MTSNPGGACGLCGQDELVFFAEKDGWPTFRCKACDLVQLSLTKKERARWLMLYTGGWYFQECQGVGYTSFEHRFAHDHWIAYPRLVNLKRHAYGCDSLLDIGCGTGALLMTAYNSGIKYVLGVEPDPWLAGQARKYSGCPVCSFLFPPSGDDLHRLIRVAGVGYDIITMIDSFEHMLEPRKALERARSLLADNGLLVIEMPDADSPGFQTQGGGWKHFKPREHSFLYGHRHVTMLLDQLGLELVDSIMPYPDRRTYYVARPGR